MSGTYHDGHRLLQDQFDTRRLADRIDERLVDDLIDSEDKAFIEEVDMFFLATADEQGHPNCSYKGGEPGFVRRVLVQLQDRFWVMSCSGACELADWSREVFRQCL